MKILHKYAVKFKGGEQGAKPVAWYVDLGRGICCLCLFPCYFPFAIF